MNNSNNIPLNWYAFYTRPRSEKKVLHLLTQKGYECYLPLMTTIRQWSDRKKKVQLPIIPSYVFVKTHPNDFNDVLNSNNVVNILKYLGKPAIIKGYEIENLKILLQDTDNIKLTETFNFEKGDTVIVEKGVFKGLIAECIEFNGKHRIILEINGWDNIFELNIPLNHIKKFDRTLA
ncbi:MAG: UpxY family transcription antiterminator [Flavobacteriaceae bacterium]|nr:UpxY family transcription antiterminator [Flavobacteriaceae bacterium]